MVKKNKKLAKTLVEKILDQHKINYESIAFETTTVKNVAQIQTNHLEIDEHLIYKTLVLTGKTTGPIVGVVPLDCHLDEKKLSLASGNKKINMVPLKQLVQTTGYEHGANTPIGIWEKHHFPIFLDESAKKQPEIYISAGKIGRSIKINPLDLQQLVQGKFVAISTPKN